QHIDEYTLAAFLAGTLPEARRREVAAYLAENADARELLCMAQEALEASQQPVVEPFSLPTAATPLSGKATERSPRPAVRRHLVRQFATPALMVVVLIIGLRIGLGLNTDQLRGDETQELTVRVSTPALQFRWTDIDDAYYYRLTIWDMDEATTVAQHETRSSRVGRNDAFVLSLLPQLESRGTYGIQIEAVDVQNRSIQRSKITEFTVQE
ncbi:MAG: hypothetical protein ACE5G0_06570, partial [Rhodothermales bacterium]